MRAAENGSFPTRRLVLKAGASSGLGLLGFSGLCSSNAHASAAAAGAAALNIISIILSSQKQGGDLELELRALHVKLDTVLLGQRHLIEAIGLINANLDRLREVVSDVPSEVIALQLTTQTGGLTKRLIEVLSALDKDPKQRRARESYEKLREELKIKVSELSVAGIYSSQVPMLVHAAQQGLLAVRLFAKYDRKLRLGDKNSKSDLLSMTGELLQTLELMTRAGEQPLASGLQRYIVKNNEELERLVSAANSSTYQAFVKKLLPPNYHKIDEAVPPHERAKGVVDVQYCLRGPDEPVNLQHEAIKDFVGETKYRTIGWKVTTRHTIKLVAISYQVSRQPSFGGRLAYEVNRAPTGWPQTTWTQTERTRSGPGVENSKEILQSDPVAKRDVCDPLADAVRGAPALYMQFQNYLGFYNAHVAIGSRLLWLRDAALKSIETCKALEKELAA